MSPPFEWNREATAAVAATEEGEVTLTEAGKWNLRGIFEPSASHLRQSWGYLFAHLGTI